MVVKELFGLGIAFVILSGITYAIFKGDETIGIIGAGGDAFANALKATRPA